MAEEKNHMDQIFRDRLRNFTPEPPPEIWDAVKSEIPAREKKRTLFVYWQIAAGMALLVSLGIAFYSLSDFDKNKQTAQTKSGEIKSNIDEDTVILPETNGLKRSAVQNSEHSAIIGKKQAGDPNISPESLSQDIQSNTQKVFASEIRIPEIHRPGNQFKIPGRVIPDSPDYPSIPRKTRNVKPGWEMFIAEEALTETKKNEKDISLAANLSPIYSFRDLSGNQKDAVVNTNFNESGVLSYAGGMNVGIKASERLSIHAGIAYSRMGVKVDGVYSLSEVALVDPMLGPGPVFNENDYLSSNSIGVISSSAKSRNFISNNSVNYSDISRESEYGTPIKSNLNSTSLSLSQFFHYLEVPLLIRYKLIDREMDLNILTGMSTNFLVSNQVFLNKESDRSLLGETGNIRNQNFSANLGLGLDYEFGTSLELSIEPQFRYYLNSINNSSLVSARPYSVGFFTGLRYRF